MNSQKGQSLFEVVLALGVITVIIVGLVILAADSIRNSVFSRNSTLATRYSQEATEWLRTERDSDFAAFQNNVLTANWCLVTLSWTKTGSCSDTDKIPETILYRDVAFSTTLVSGKTVIEAAVRVYWTDAQGYHEVKSDTFFSDWRQR